MKTILIILALTIQLSGRVIYDTPESTLVAISIRGEFKSYSTVGTELLKLLKQYEQECYADSFLSYTYCKSTFYEQIDSVVVLTAKDGDEITFNVSDLAKLVKVYTHREPTFKGFIEFLRKK